MNTLLSHSKLFFLTAILSWQSAPIATTFAEDFIPRPQETAAEINKGFEGGDTKPLRQFLASWESRTAAVTAEELKEKPEFEQAVYGLYPAFFKPVVEGKYVIIQDEVPVRLVNFDLRKVFEKDLNEFNNESLKRKAISSFVLKEFRPEIKVAEKRVLYRNDARITVLASFLVGEPTDADDQWQQSNGDDQLDELEAEEKQSPRKRRTRYLNSNLNIIPGHWGNGWHFSTHPEVHHVILSKDLDVAIVYFREGYEGGEALLEKKEDKWRIVEKEFFWVE